MTHKICPYFETYGKRCKLYDSPQEDYQAREYCLTDDKWFRCANYEEARKTNNPRL